MNRTVENGRTLLVDGPASVTLSSGKVEVFGSAISEKGKVVIREGKRLPFAVQERAVLDISLGENAAVEEVDGNTIPSSWIESAQELLDLQTRPVTAMIFGNADSGKTGFCTYLLNRVLREKRKVAVLDGDLGQSDVGPPSTVAYAFVNKAVTDLFNLQAKNAFFIGETSPGNAVDKMIEGLSLLKKEIMATNPEFLVINTDGWVEGECAVAYKLKLAEELEPGVIFCIRQTDELAPLLTALEKFKKVTVESPVAIRRRDSERRKTLRELGYKKYLRNPRVQSLSLSWLKVEGNDSFGLTKPHMNNREARRICDLLGMKPLQLSELSDRISIVIGRRRWISSDNIKKVEQATKKRVVVTRKGEEERLLAALYDDKRRFLGIGILQEVDYLRKALKVITPVSEEASILVLGKVKLDKNMKEISLTAEENNLDFSSFKKLF
ncbi:MAG: Clp1/GlmU family protein [Candidatus Bathyarchaeia archaeon]